MANEIQMTYDTGATLYALVFNAAGQVCSDPAGSPSFVAYVEANQDNYDIPLSEVVTNSRQYRGTFPVVAAGIYAVVVHEQDGANPTSSDPQRGAAELMYWDGSEELTISHESQVDRNLGLSASYDGTTAKMGLWLEERGQRQTDVTSITDVEIWNAATDAQVVDLGDETVDSSDGVFYFSSAVSLSYNTPYYVKATVNKGGSSYALQAGLVRI